MTGRPETVCIVIPTRGDSYTLGVTLASLNLELPLDASVEVILVHDGDGPVMDEMTAQDYVFPLRQAWTGRRTGPAHARNLGARSTATEVVVFMDDDVLVPFGWFRNLRYGLEEQPQAGLMGGPIRPKDVDNLVSQMFEAFVIRHHEDAAGRIHLASACLVVRRSALNALDGFDERFPDASGEDWDLSHRAHEMGIPIAVEPRLHVHHWHPTRFRGILSRAGRYAASSALISERLDDPRVGTGSRPTSDRLPPWVSAVAALKELRRRFAMARELHGRRRSAVLLLLHLPWFVSYGLAVRHRR